VASGLVEDVRRLPREQKLAGGAALALFVSMFLPWYQVSFNVKTHTGAGNLSAFEVFSWVEAAVLLVAGSVLFLLYARSERRGFHLPGGDGFVVMLAGGWVAALLLWRMFDKPSVGDPHNVVGIQWGIFVALLAAGTLTWAGVRMRAAHRPEPPLPPAVTEDAPVPPRPPGRSPAPKRERAPDRRPHTAPTEPLGDAGEQLALDDPPAYDPSRRSP
jgi:hypothetical protein